MRLRVEYMGQLQAAVGRPDECVELPEGATVSALAAHLGECSGDHVRPHLLTPSGQLQPTLLVAINGTARPSRDAAEIVLREGDTVILLPPIAGG